jgi:hypothetical protein
VELCTIFREFVQVDLGLKVNNFECDIIGHCGKKVHIDMYLFLNDNREMAVRNPKYKSFVSDKKEDGLLTVN